jgi:hypothetical protein
LFLSSQSDTLPDPKTLLEANSKLQILEAFRKAKDGYNEEMGKIFEGQKYLTVAQFEKQHSQLKKEAFDAFTCERKLAGKKLLVSDNQPILS